MAELDFQNLFRFPIPFGAPLRLWDPRSWGTSGVFSRLSSISSNCLADTDRFSVALFLPLAKFFSLDFLSFTEKDLLNGFMARPMKFLLFKLSGIMSRRFKVPGLKSTILTAFNAFIRMI